MDLNTNEKAPKGNRGSKAEGESEGGGASGKIKLRYNHPRSTATYAAGAGDDKVIFGGKGSKTCEQSVDPERAKRLLAAPEVLFVDPTNGSRTMFKPFEEVR